MNTNKKRYVKGDRYFFDKRVIKAALIKYGIMFLIALPILIVMNVYWLKDLSFWASTFIDVGVLLIIVLLCLIIYSRITKIKETKMREREEREREIKRAERKLKRRTKKNQTKEPKKQVKVEDIEIIEPNDKE